MSAPVDVLKAMRVAEAYCYDAGASSAAKNLRAASDAVAELIEADKEYDAARRWWDQGCYTGWDGVSDETRKTTAARYEAALSRRAAALARVQGVRS